jgi:hypothetical protein
MTTATDTETAPSTGLILTYEWGYSMIGNGPYQAILPDGYSTRWFDSRAKAEGLRRNDLRWRYETVVIKRLVGPIEAD